LSHNVRDAAGAKAFFDGTLPSDLASFTIEDAGVFFAQAFTVEFCAIPR
jgi:hypothetical protein